MNSLPGTIAPDGVLRRVSDLRRALPPCISRPDLKIKIPLTPPVRSNDRHTAFVRGIFSALPRAGSCGLAKPRRVFDKTCVGRRIAELRKAFAAPPHSVLLLRAPMRKCENRHHSRNKERCRKVLNCEIRATRSHRRALRVRCRAPRLPPSRGPRANGIPM